MTNEQIAADRKIIEAATEGPWVWSLWKKHNSSYEVRRLDGLNNADVINADDKGDMYHPNVVLEVSPDDRDFIAAARTHWPAALDALEEAMRRIVELESKYLEADRDMKSWD